MEVKNNKILFNSKIAIILPWYLISLKKEMYIVRYHRNNDNLIHRINILLFLNFI